MSNIPEDLQYSPNHTWLEVHSGGYLRVGITDFAQQELGDVVFVELPEIGRHYDEDEECGLIESVKSASDLYCPVAGEVIAVNTEIEDSPEMINGDPYADGWIFEIKPDDSTESGSLIQSTEYEELIKEE